MKANFVKSKFQREIDSHFPCTYQRSHSVTTNFIRRFGLVGELEGHQGCVNCLEWNEQGTLLASGSDDVRIIIWDALRQKCLTSIHTGHQGNIFSVKFLPESSDSVVVSGAADCRICVHDITTNQTTNILSCHSGRVKRLDTAPSVPFLFWSASEDGTVRQFDLRSPDVNQPNPANVLVNLATPSSPHTEAKCLSINKLRPYQLAVGANDPYVRLYDRRMLSCTSGPEPSDTIIGTLLNKSETDPNKLPHGCVKYLVAGHLPQKQLEYRKRYRTLASTFVTFGPDGTELLVNLGGEQIYLFDVNNPKKTRNFHLPFNSNGIVKDTSIIYGNGYSTPNGVASSNGMSATNGVSNGCYSNSIVNTNGILSTTGIGKIHNVASALVDTKPTPNRVAEALSDKRKRSYAHYVSCGAEQLKKSANAFFEKEEYTKAIILYNEAVRLASDVAVLYGNRAAALMKRRWDGDLYAALRDCLTAIRLDTHHLKAHFRLARCLYKLTWPKEAYECLEYFKRKFPDVSKSHACDALERDIKAAIYAHTDDTAEKVETSDAQYEDQESLWRQEAYDYKQRFCGHCNTTTDIKEANYFGSNSQCIVAGSDDGSFFIWDKQTTNIMQVLRGDDSIVNCLQPHPTSCLLATSGIDLVVRLWGPSAEDGRKNEREIDNSDDAASANQKRMNADPLEVILMNMGYRITSLAEEEEEEEGDGGEQPASCRPS